MSRSPHLEFIRDTWHGVFYFPTIDEAGHSTYKRKRISLAIKGKAHKRRAQKELSRIEREILLDNREAPTTTVQDLASEYLKSAKLNVRDRTFQIYRNAVSLFLSMWGNLDCADINAMHIERFKEQLRNRYRIATVNIQVRSVRTMFAYGVRMRLLSKNPCEGIKQYRPEPKGFPPFITMDEFDRVVDLLNAKIAQSPAMSDSYLRQLTVLSLAMYAGLRRAEAQNLMWKHVDLVNQEIRVAVTETFTTKSGKERTVPIIPRLEKVLLRLKQTGLYVLTGTDSPPTQTYATTVWLRLRREIQRPIKIPYHGLRHSFATWLSSQPGVSLKTVSEVLGHSDIQTTMIYSHVQRSDLDKLKKLN